MREEGVEPKRLRWVYSFKETEAALLLAEGAKGARSELLVLPPLVVYERAGTYTAEVKAMLGGWFVRIFPFPGVSSEEFF